MLKSIFRGASGQRQVHGRLALLIPTYRIDERARHTIAGAASLASEDIAVVIADNSENPGKWSFLKELANLNSNIHIHCHPKNIGAYSNWRYLFDQATLEYYLFVGDDDTFTPEYVRAGLEQLVALSDASAAAGRMLMVTSTNQLIIPNGARLESDPAERCMNFRIGGGNSLPNSVARRRAADGFLTYIASHPLRSSFFDWFMSCYLLAHGKYLVTDRGHYLYDVSNWESPKACWDSNAKYYVQAGLPETFCAFHELYWAVESVHLFLGSYSPLADVQQRRACAAFFFEDRINDFRKVWRDPSAKERLFSIVPRSRDARETIGYLAESATALDPNLFTQFARLVETFDATCAAAYLDYVSSSLKRAAPFTPSPSPELSERTI